MFTRHFISKMLHEILLSLWGCSTSVSQVIEIDVSIFYDIILCVIISYIKIIKL